MSAKSTTTAVYECRICAAIYILRGDDERRECVNEAYKGVTCKQPLVLISAARLRSVFIETAKVSE